MLLGNCLRLPNNTVLFKFSQIPPIVFGKNNFLTFQINFSIDYKYHTLRIFLLEMFHLLQLIFFLNVTNKRFSILLNSSYYNYSSFYKVSTYHIQHSHYR